jgi:hypothetical protein
MTNKPLFEVDKEGLAKILARRGIEFAVTELIQNAWDEDVTEVHATLTPVEGRRARYTLRVEDDSPEGFLDLAHAYTLFADSYKKDDPELRGRFNLGEKLVIALCESATVMSTKGTIIFGSEGRSESPVKTERGTIFEGVIRMTKEEAKRTTEVVNTLIAPEDIETTFNGSPLPDRKPVKTFRVGSAIPTEVSDEDGFLRRVRRSTEVGLYATLPGEKATLYEMGIPVVETGDTWHVNVYQKVPLNTDRDNVTPSYLREIRKEVLNNAHDLLDEESAGERWVDNAMEDNDVSGEAVNAAMDARYTEKRVIFDPSDPEGNKLAVSQGYQVIAPRALSKKAWEHVREHEAAAPAGQVTPSPKVLAGAEGKPGVPREKWTPGMVQIAEYAEALASRLMKRSITVQYHNDAMYQFAAWYGGRTLTFNVGRLGYRWFEQGATDAVNRLLIHEFGHEYSDDHLAHGYHDALCRLGARLARLALDEPEFFAEYTDGVEEIETTEVLG